MRLVIVIIWALLLLTEIVCIVFAVPVQQGLRYSNALSYSVGLSMAVELWMRK